MSDERRALDAPTIWRSEMPRVLEGSALVYCTTPPRLLLEAVPNALPPCVTVASDRLSESTARPTLRPLKLPYDMSPSVIPSKVCPTCDDWKPRMVMRVAHS
ncbi:MAG: hypothetical protein IPP20_04990 [Gemmatimonadetes bacterium]|nr:hypothetical protein [Gemmatimonadota bacterium]